MVAIVVVVVLVIVWICNLFTNTAENAAKAHIKSLSNQDVGAYIDLCPDDYIDELLDNYDLSKKRIGRKSSNLSR
ncbi:MAG: hypothetical protein LIO74_00705 [Ruminococcus sp.]|nr:hypothetical protein [Ruminococcus sp.]